MYKQIYFIFGRSLLVFGGFTPDYARFPKRLSSLQTFHVDEQVWSDLQYSQSAQSDPSQPRDRAYHSANIMGNYMVVYGGNYHIHHEEEICYDDGIYIYHLGCHVWVDIRKLLNSFGGWYSF